MLTIDTTSTGGKTLSHTCTSGATFLLVIAAQVSLESSPASTMTATYNGVSMTAIVEHVSSRSYCKLFGLVNPASGAHNIVVTTDYITDGGVSGVSFINSDSIIGWRTGVSGAKPLTPTSSPTDLAFCCTSIQGGTVVNPIGDYTSIFNATFVSGTSPTDGDTMRYAAWRMNGASPTVSMSADNVGGFVAVSIPALPSSGVDVAISPYMIF